MSNLGVVERVKLAANLANGLAIAILTVGVFGPIAAMVYGSPPPTSDSGILWSLPVVCICAATVLHFVGHLVLTVLDEVEDAS